MTGKARFIFPVVNLGVAPDVLSRWMRAFAIAWPGAAFVACLALPAARATSPALVARIEG